MEKYDEKSLITTLFNTTVNAESNGQKCDLISLASTEVNDKVAVKKSLLLSLDGWEKYQKELMRLCFEFWEVNESHKKNAQSEINDTELQTPSSLFADTDSSDGNMIGFAPRASATDKVLMTKRFRDEECVEFNDGSLKSEQQNDDPTFVRRFSEVIHDDRKTYGNKSKTADNGNKRSQKKKSKKFSFYKPAKPSKKPSALDETSASCTLEDLWKYKRWLDSVEKIELNEGGNNCGVKGVATGHDCCSCGCGDASSSQDVEEANRMERNVRKLIKSLMEKDDAFGSLDGSEQTAAAGPSSKLRCFFKNAFRANQLQQQQQQLGECDPQLLDDYAKYIGRRLHTWRALLRCLEDIKRRECRKTEMTEDAIEYRFSEIKEGGGGDDDDEKKTGGCKLPAGIADDKAKRRKNVFFKLLDSGCDKARSATDLRPARNLDRGEAAAREAAATADCGGRHLSSESGGSGASSSSSSSSSSSVAVARMRKSSSETDLSRAAFRTDPPDPRCARALDAACRALCDERQERFRTAVARLEYVGSTFREQHRLTGLKTLCQVDVLAGCGRPAEAVDLFVQSALPLSDNPDAMIRRAEAAYDWTFFCHLSMWRHSYKD